MKPPRRRAPTRQRTAPSPSVDVESAGGDGPLCRLLGLDPAGAERLRRALRVRYRPWRLGAPRTLRELVQNLLADEAIRLGLLGGLLGRAAAPGRVAVAAAATPQHLLEAQRLAGDRQRRRGVTELDDRPPQPDPQAGELERERRTAQAAIERAKVAADAAGRENLALLVRTDYAPESGPAAASWIAPGSELPAGDGDATVPDGQQARLEWERRQALAAARRQRDEQHGVRIRAVRGEPEAAAAMRVG